MLTDSISVFYRYTAGFQYSGGYRLFSTLWQLVQKQKCPIGSNHVDSSQLFLRFSYPRRSGDILDDRSPRAHSSDDEGHRPDIRPLIPIRSVARSEPPSVRIAENDVRSIRMSQSMKYSRLNIFSWMRISETGSMTAECWEGPLKSRHGRCRFGGLSAQLLGKNFSLFLGTRIEEAALSQACRFAQPVKDSDADDDLISSPRWRRPGR